MTRDSLPDWLVGAGDVPLGLPDLDLPDLDAPPTERLTRTPPPIPVPPPRAAAWQVAAREAAPDTDARTFRFDVVNTSGTEHREFRAEFALPQGGSASVTRKAVRTRRGLEWNLGVLPPGGAVGIAVRLPKAASAVPVQIATRVVAEARLEVVGRLAPVEWAGRRTTATATVTNAGEYDIADVRMDVFGTDPEAAVATHAVGRLKAGESREVELSLTPWVGFASFRVVASAAGATTGTGVFETLGVQPEAAVRLNVPPSLGTDEEITGRVVVSNRTLLPLAGFRAAVTLPDELVFRGATQRGALSEKGDGVEWEIGELAAGGEWSAELRLVGFSPGRVKLLATTTADGLDAVTTAARMTCEVRRSAGGMSLAEVLAGLSVPVFDAAQESAPAQARTAHPRHLLFGSADTRFALPIGSVREILKPLPVAPVPGVPDWVCGVANVRGDIVTVVDLASLLGLGETGAGRGFVVVRGDDGATLALLVGEVFGIQPLAGGDRVPADERLAPYLAGVSADTAGLVHRLDPAALLGATEGAAAAG